MFVDTALEGAELHLPMPYQRAPGNRTVASGWRPRVSWNLQYSVLDYLGGSGLDRMDTFSTGPLILFELCPLAHSTPLLTAYYCLLTTSPSTQCGRTQLTPAACAL